MASQRPPGQMEITSEGVWETLMCCVCGDGVSDLVYKSNLEPGFDLRYMFWSIFEETKRRRFHSDIVKCQGCNHVYSSPYLSQKALEYCCGESKYDNECGVDERFLSETLSQYYHVAAPYVREKENVVDIGCDTGLLLKIYEKSHFKSILGIEPSQKSYRTAMRRFSSQGHVNVINSFYEDKHCRPSSVDMISLIHVLDHVLNPRQLLDRVRSHLKEKGVIVAVVHDVSSLLSRLTGEGFPPIVLQHAQFFSKKSLKQLLETMGFKVAVLHTVWNKYPLTHYMKNAPFISEKIKDTIVSAMNKVKLGSIGLKLNLGNIVIVCIKE